MSPSPNNYFLKLIDPNQLEEKVEELRTFFKRIVTLNGSFDLLHAGHLQILHEAALQGDVFIVALNTDRSVKTYKSEKRPIIPLQQRLTMMSALSMVDYVTWFDEPDPRVLLSKIKPDVHVNGAEYGENCLESDVVRANGGRVHVVQLVPGLSTSCILEKIRQL